MKLRNNDAGMLGGTFLFLALLRLYLTREAFDPLYAGLLAIALYFGLSLLQNREYAVPKWIGTLIIFNADFSYTLYLVHYTVLDVLFRSRGLGLENALIAFVLSNVFAIILYMAFERHYKAFGNRLRKSLSIPS